MSIHNLKPLSEVMADLKKQGYTADFNFRKHELHDDENGSTVKPVDVIIKNEFRFEGESNPGDSSILYAIETRDGIKGTLVNAYGADTDVELEEFLDEVQRDDIKN